MSLEKITVVSTLGATATHLEGHLERISLRLMEATLSQLMALASMESRASQEFCETRWLSGQGPLGGRKRSAMCVSRMKTASFHVESVTKGLRTLIVHV